MRVRQVTIHYCSLTQYLYTGTIVNPYPNENLRLSHNLRSQIHQNLPSPKSPLRQSLCRNIRVCITQTKTFSMTELPTQNIVTTFVHKVVE